MKNEKFAYPEKTIIKKIKMYILQVLCAIIYSADYMYCKYQACVMYKRVLKDTYFYKLEIQIITHLY